jgi:type II protein arginine methyltransferase
MTCNQALDLTPPLPLTIGVLNKWMAEPTRQILLPSSTFIANAKGYPVLPKGTQSFLREIMKVGLEILSILIANNILYMTFP